MLVQKYNIATKYVHIVIVIFQLVFVLGKYFSSHSLPEMPLIRGNVGY